MPPKTQKERSIHKRLQNYPRSHFHNSIGRVRSDLLIPPSVSMDGNQAPEHADPRDVLHHPGHLYDSVQYLRAQEAQDFGQAQHQDLQTQYPYIRKTEEFHQPLVYQQALQSGSEAALPYHVDSSYIQYLDYPSHGASNDEAYNVYQRGSGTGLAFPDFNTSNWNPAHAHTPSSDVLSEDGIYSSMDYPPYPMHQPPAMYDETQPSPLFQNDVNDIPRSAECFELEGNILEGQTENPSHSGDDNNRQYDSSDFFVHFPHYTPRTR